ncbi:hypothetical protein, partial [Mycobacteroides abscessus]
FTYEGTNQNDACSDVNKRSLSSFASLKVAGLGSRTTIIKYRRAWSQAITDGVATDVKPGDLIDLPDVEWQEYFNPPLPKMDKPSVPAKRPGTALAKWDEESWDSEKINSSDRLVRMSDVMWDTLDGVNNEKLVRVAQSIIDFVGDENKARGIARMMHSVIEFVSEYKSATHA